MSQPPHQDDEDQDSLFGSPPPSPLRGRSPSQETAIRGEELSPGVAISSTGASMNVHRKNVGTIALPGSHMSCAELPANLPASSSPLPLPGSSQDSLSIPRPSVAGTPVASQSRAGSVPSRPTSTTSSAPSASTSTRNRRAPKARSTASAPPPALITLPGPNEPTPPNFLRSQSALLGHAGLVGSVKPAKLHTHERPSAQSSRSETPARGSTPTHPIVLDDDQENRQVRQRQSSQIQLSQRLDQLNPEVFRTNILNSLAKEKNTLPVLESLIKLLGGEPQLPPPSHPPPQPFARPYGYGVFDTQSTPSAGSPSAPSVAPLPKRRKLKHVPAGAADWDVPFPFAPGEGPEAYRETWARDRAKQLVTQLLELVQNATKKAAIKTAKSRVQKGRGKTPQTRTGAESSRDPSVETLGEQSLQQTATSEAAKLTSSAAESTTQEGMTAMPMDGLDDFLRSLQIPDTIGSTSTSGPSDGVSVSSTGMAEESGTPDFDYSAFEEWLSQLQQLMPSEPDVSTPDSDWSTRQSVSLNSTSSRASSIPAPIPPNTAQTPHTIRDEAIDPTLLAISYPTASTSQTRSIIPSPTTHAPTSIDTQTSDIASPPPPLAHSPRTSLSSFTEPLTPLSDAFTEAPPTSMIAHEEHVRDPSLCVPKAHQLIEKDRQAEASSYLTEPAEDEPPRLTAAQKGKGRADPGISSSTPSASVSSRSTPDTVSATKGKLDKQAIVARAKERRKQLVAEIERAKIELWETTIEAGVLVHLMRDDALTRDAV